MEELVKHDTLYEIISGSLDTFAAIQFFHFDSKFTVFNNRTKSFNSHRAHIESVVANS